MVSFCFSKNLVRSFAKSRVCLQAKATAKASQSENPALVMFRLCAGASIRMCAFVLARMSGFGQFLLQQKSGSFFCQEPCLLASKGDSKSLARRESCLGYVLFVRRGIHKDVCFCVSEDEWIWSVFCFSKKSGSFFCQEPCLLASKGDSKSLAKRESCLGYVSFVCKGVHP